MAACAAEKRVCKLTKTKRPSPLTQPTSLEISLNGAITLETPVIAIARSIPRHHLTQTGFGGAWLSHLGCALISFSFSVCSGLGQLQEFYQLV